MDWKDIIKETGIEVIWIDRDYSKSGSFIAKCPEFPYGAIVLSIGLKELNVEPVALHEIGHLVSGKTLALVNKRLKHLEHCRNEAQANRFTFRNIAPRFVEENDYNPIWANPHKLCNFLNIECTFENIWIAQEEIENAIWNRL